MRHSQILQSSPGYLQVGHVPSKWTWQIPQTSSSGRSHFQVATVSHRVILTFIAERFCWGASVFVVISNKRLMLCFGLGQQHG